MIRFIREYKKIGIKAPLWQEIRTLIGTAASETMPGTIVVKNDVSHGFGKNTGIGLFLAREILSITGITIRETGTPGKGTRFEITVPKGAYQVAGEK